MRDVAVGADIPYRGLLIYKKHANRAETVEFRPMREVVLVMAYRGEPLKRILVDVGERVFYLANPERIAAVEAGESNPVGFPREDVFMFDEDVFSVLVEEWARQRTTDPATWRRLTPYAIRASMG